MTGSDEGKAQYAEDGYICLIESHLLSPLVLIELYSIYWNQPCLIKHKGHTLC